MIGPLILASASPRRRELLERAGIALEIVPANIDETPHDGESPAAYVARIADAKARAVARPPGRTVLAADTTVTIDGAILGKPADAAEAAAMLRRLVDRTHQVMTAFAIVADRVHECVTVVTDVDLTDRALSIPAYIATGEWRDKAGAYAIQGIGAALVRTLRGSLTNVIGLPLPEVIDHLGQLGQLGQLGHGDGVNVVDR